MKIRRLNIFLSFLLLSFCLSMKVWGVHKYRGYYLNHSDRTGKGLRAYYFDNREWKGRPVSTRIDSKISLNDLPLPETNFSIDWHGLLRIPVSGRYKFKLFSDDGSWLILNSKRIVNNKGIHPAEKKSSRRYIRKGIYPIEIKYFQAEGLVALNLYWRPPRPFRELRGDIPAEYLIPVNNEFDRNTACRLMYNIKRWDILIILSLAMLILSFTKIPGICLKKIHAVIRNNPAAFIILSMVFAARILFIGTVPGVYGDETWFPNTAHAFLEGRDINLFRGMTAYTGPYYLLQAPIYILFGFNVIAMRCLAFCLGFLAIIFCYILIKHLYNKTTALFSTLILGFFPYVVIQNRINSDLLNFSFFFTVTSFYLIYQRKSWQLILAGFLLGVGTYNHLLFIAIPISIFLLCMVETKGKVLLSRQFYLTLIPILLIMSIKYYDVKTHGPGRTFAPPTLEEGLYLLRYSTINILPKLFDGILNYREFTGRILIEPVPVNLLIVILSMVIITLKRNILDRNIFRLLFITAVVYIIITMRIPCPRLRYFDIPVTLTMLLPAIVLGKLIRYRKIIISALLLLVVTNIFYLSINYFYSFKKYKGGFFTMQNDRLRFSVFIKSHHHIDTRKLYNFLVDMGITRVATNYYIANNLAFRDIGKNHLYCYKENEFTGRKDEALIFYAKGIPGKTSFPEQLGYEGLREIKEVKYFRIYIKDKGINPSS